MAYCENNKHEWEVTAPASHAVASDSPTYVWCKVCHITMTLAEVKQIEAVNNQTESVNLQARAYEHMVGFQKKWSILTIVISICAIVISIIGLTK